MTPLAACRWRRACAGWLAACLVLCAGGCRKDMYDQPRYEDYEPSAFFVDGTSSRPIVPGTVARGELRADVLYYEGKIDGKDADVFPFADRRGDYWIEGRDRFMVFCMPCHGQLGNGRGMVVRRGFSPPPDFHSEYLRKIPIGHFYNVITHGYGAMYSYEARIPVRQRWAIAAYIRALQYSQDASSGRLTSDVKKLAEAEKPGQPTQDDRKSPGRGPEMNPNGTLYPLLERIRSRALVVGLAGAAACVVGASSMLTSVPTTSGRASTGPISSRTFSSSGSRSAQWRS